MPGGDWCHVRRRAVPEVAGPDAQGRRRPVRRLMLLRAGLAAAVRACRAGARRARRRAEPDAGILG